MMHRYRWIGILTWTYAALLVYASLVPFDFSFVAPSAAHGSMLGIDMVALHLPDALSNLALYVPLGMLFRAWWQRRGASGVGAFAWTVAIGTVFSFCVESAQIFSMSRISSIGDVLCNVIGTGFGALLIVPERFLYRRAVKAAADEIDQEASGTLLGGWAIVIALLALAPLDLTFDVSHIKAAVRDAHFVPFAKHADLAELSIAGDGSRTGAMVLVDMWQLRLDYIADVFLFAVLAVLAVHWSLRRGFARPRALVHTVGIAIGMSILTTCAEMFVVSVGFDVTRMLTRGLGGLLGTVGAAFAISDSRTRTPWKYLAVLCGTYIVARSLVPFRFEVDRMASAAAMFEWIPLHSYTLATLPAAAADGLHKAFRFIALGGCFAFGWLAIGTVISQKKRIAIGVLAAFMVTLLEMVQTAIPGRFPSVTDILIAGIMTPVGMVIAERLTQFAKRGSMASHATLSPMILNAPIPQPSNDAPKERAARRRRTASTR